MDSNLRHAWTTVITPADYEEHMARIGQAQASAVLNSHLIDSARPPTGGRVVIAGAGTGQMFDFLDAEIFRPFELTCTDLNRHFLDVLEQRLACHRLSATLIEDDIENTTLKPGADLILATLVLEHIDWRRGVEVLAALRPAACGVVIQQNPEGMATAVTPGRLIPESIAKAVETAHPALVPYGELVAGFVAQGYRCTNTRTEEVADGKRLIAVLFER
jgi:hypothetical protein